MNYNMNLLPKKMRKNKRKLQVVNPTYAPILLLVSVIVIAFLWTNVQSNIKKTKDEIDEYVNKITSLNSQVENIKQQSDSARNASSEVQVFINNTGTSWNKVLNEITHIVPGEITIEKTKQITSNTIQLNGSTSKFYYLTKMKNAMSQSPIFENVEVHYAYTGSNVLEKNVNITFVITAMIKNGTTPQNNSIQNPDVSMLTQQNIQPQQTHSSNVPNVPNGLNGQINPQSQLPASTMGNQAIVSPNLPIQPNAIRNEQKTDNPLNVSISNQNPKINSQIMISIKGIKNAKYEAIFNYKNKIEKTIGNTDNNGNATIKKYIGKATIGYTVNVDVTLTNKDGLKQNATVKFNPQK